GRVRLSSPVGALTCEQPTDLEGGAALERVHWYAVGPEVGRELLRRDDLGPPTVGRRQDVEPRRIGETRAPAVRALDDRAPQRDLAEGGAEHGPAEAVAEARGGAVGDLRRAVEVPGRVDPAAAVERGRPVLDRHRRPGAGMEPAAALGAQSTPP